MYRGVGRRLGSLARPRCNSILWLMCRLHARSCSCLPCRHHPLFPTYPRAAQPSVDHPCTQPLARVCTRLTRSLSLSLVRLHYVQCTATSSPPPLQSYRKRPRIRILLRALYVHRTGRVYVLTVYICIIQCSRERYRRVCGRARRRPENPPLRRRRVSVYTRVWESERERERGCMFVCVLPTSRRMR